MSGHSHWSGIKHKKELNDQKRAKVFTKYAKLITIAARGGGNPETNFQLKLAIDKAKAVNMPKDNIERAVKSGTGELKGNALEEVVYEAMGPGNIMMIIKATTDNRNRTVSEVKSILAKAGGKMGEVGSTAWNFERVGSIYVSAEEKDIDEVEMIAIEAGARDTKIEENSVVVFTGPADLQRVQKNLEKKDLEILDSGLVYIPKTMIEIDDSTKLDYEKLLETLDEQDDVEEIYDNL